MWRILYIFFFFHFQKVLNRNCSFEHPVNLLLISLLFDLQEYIQAPFIRKQGNIYKPNNKDMDNDSILEKTALDVHTKEIDLVNRDPNHINDDVVKVRTFLTQ